MLPLNKPTSCVDVEKYVLEQLQNIYVGYRKPIMRTTSFAELERGADSDFTRADFFLDIEDDFDIFMTEEEGETLNAGDVNGVIDYIARKLGL